MLPSRTAKSVHWMPCTDRGVTVEHTPNIQKMLKRLLPTTFPIAMSLLPLRAATTLVANSGSDVPPATNVRPMTASLTPS